MIPHADWGLVDGLAVLVDRALVRVLAREREVVAVPLAAGRRVLVVVVSHASVAGDDADGDIAGRYVGEDTL